MVSKSVEQFVVSPQQVQLDLKMVGADIWGTKAHVLMLQRTKIVSKKNAVAILQALAEIQRLHEAGDFSIDPQRGAQLTLEKEIVARAGEEAGLSAHTARSRNDQVMVTELLFLREEVLHLASKLEKCIKDLLVLSRDHVSTVMPGYTHMQPGKPTTFAHWSLLYVASLRRVLAAFYEKLERYDACPLGSVESFGTSWPIDRSFTADLLGFSAVWSLPLDAISHRGFFQFELLQALALGGVTLSRVASDLLQYTTFEYGLVDLGDNVAQRLHPITGSSVMAQKRNPDALELMRAAGNQINGSCVAAFELLSGLPAGYNRDSRELKEYVEVGIRKFTSGIEVLSQVVTTLQVKSDRMESLVRQNYSLTTDLADFVAQKSGVPYRKVYKIVGQAVDELIRSGRSLEELEAKRLTEIATELGSKVELTNKDLQEVLVPSEALARRAHIGGTSSETTMQIIEGEEVFLQGYRERRLQWEKRVSDAQVRTQKAISVLLSAEEEAAA
ncbi:MAG: argininosuccinate lyase [Bdellovibrionales bacterium]|nr:argininosuccinate lyase [Bdellovibrionales bacterium]